MKNLDLHSNSVQYYTEYNAVNTVPFHKLYFLLCTTNIYLEVCTTYLHRTLGFLFILSCNLVFSHWWYPLFNKNQAAWNFLSPELEVTWRTVAIIIQVVLLSSYLCIRGIPLSSNNYNQSRTVYINQRHQHILLIWS
jgi:hypothetical protein